MFTAEESHENEMCQLLGGVEGIAMDDEDVAEISPEEEEDVEIGDEAVDVNNPENVADLPAPAPEEAAAAAAAAPINVEVNNNALDFIALNNQDMLNNNNQYLNRNNQLLNNNDELLNYNNLNINEPTIDPDDPEEADMEVPEENNDQEAGAADNPDLAMPPEDRSSTPPPMDDCQAASPPSSPGSPGLAQAATPKKPEICVHYLLTALDGLITFENEYPPAEPLRIMYQGRNILDLGANISGGWGFRPSQVPLAPSLNYFAYGERLPNDNYNSRNESLMRLRQQREELDNRLREIEERDKRHPRNPK